MFRYPGDREIVPLGQVMVIRKVGCPEKKTYG